nr:hypothetical transcript [Hymenolepis microstoma]
MLTTTNSTTLHICFNSCFNEITSHGFRGSTTHHFHSNQFLKCLIPHTNTFNLPLPHPQALHSQLSKSSYFIPSPPPSSPPHPPTPPPPLPLPHSRTDADADGANTAMARSSLLTANPILNYTTSTLRTIEPTNTSTTTTPFPIHSLMALFTIPHTINITIIQHTTLFNSTRECIPTLHHQHRQPLANTNQLLLTHRFHRFAHLLALHLRGHSPRHLPHHHHQTHQWHQQARTLCNLLQGVRPSIAPRNSSQSPFERDVLWLPLLPQVLPNQQLMHNSPTT